MPGRNRFTGSDPVNEKSSQNQPPAPGQGRSKKRKIKQNQADSASIQTTPSVPAPRSETANNTNDVGDVGGSMEDLAAAVPTAAKEKLPPLVVTKMKLENLRLLLENQLGVKAEYKLTRIGTKVMIGTRAEYNYVAEFLKKYQVEFFTHDIASEKPFKVVIRGLPNKDAKEVEEEIVDRYKLVPTAVYRIKRKDENVKEYPDALYLVHFKKGTVTMNALKAIRSLFSVIIRWEPYRGGHRDVTQCQHCLSFGHGTRNCHVKPRCGNCAQAHATSDCPSAEAEDKKCANCGGAHQGSDRQCPKRAEFKRIRQQASNSNQPGRKKEVPVPKPSEFPPLNPRGNPAPPNPGAWTGRGAPTPPGPRPQPAPQNNNPDLWSADELLVIFEQMTGALHQCRSKREQVTVLGRFIIQYGV